MDDAKPKNTPLMESPPSPPAEKEISKQMEDLKNLKALLDSGAINEDEYATMKRKIMGE